MTQKFTENISYMIHPFPCHIIYSHMHCRQQHTGWPKKRLNCIKYIEILTDFLNYFTVRIRRKFVIILSLKIPPHLKCVATRDARIYIRGQIFCGYPQFPTDTDRIRISDFKTHTDTDRIRISI